MSTAMASTRSMRMDGSPGPGAAGGHSPAFPGGPMMRLARGGGKPFATFRLREGGPRTIRLAEPHADLRPRHRRDHPAPARVRRRAAPGGADGPTGAGMKRIGVDVGSTTVKAVVVEDGRVTWQDYQRHH